MREMLDSENGKERVTTSQALFDRMAHLYDATRGYPPLIEQQIAQALERAALARSQTTFLEVGIGTGRIALPLASLGYKYTGVDISEKMIEQLERKLRHRGWLERAEMPWGSVADEDQACNPSVHRFVSTETKASLRVVRADIRTLPFHDASFDVLVAAHIFHLLEDWQGALEEVLRVLRPGGLFLQCWEEAEMEEMRRIGDEWRKIISMLGQQTAHPVMTFYREMHLPTERIVQWLHQRHGAPTEHELVLSWEEWKTPREAMQSFEQRHWSLTWMVPDALFQAALPLLWQWAERFYGTELDTARPQKRRVFISRTRLGQQVV